MVQRSRRLAKLRKLAIGAALSWCSACWPATAAAQPAASAPLPAARPATVWSWLGIPQGVHRVRDTVVNRCGRLPGLERKPPLLRIADPALAEIDNAAIKKAQQIKAEEDLAPQKIKAIKYLATLGCEKCYGGIDEAMLESLKDCTEKVRYETVKALASIPNEKCPHCDNDCCSEKITEQLAKMAYERDPDHPDCWLEPSARVRREALETLRICCCDRTAPPDATGPTERTTAPPPVEGGGQATPIEPGASANGSHGERFARRSYDTTIAVHIAPRRSYDADEPPSPSGRRSAIERSIVARTTVDRTTVARATVARAIVDADVQTAHFVEDAPLPSAATPQPRYTPSRQAMAPHTTARHTTAPHPRTSPTQANAYGRRFVTWGIPHGEYSPPTPPEPRPTVRRGILD